MACAHRTHAGRQARGVAAALALLAGIAACGSGDETETAGSDTTTVTVGLVPTVNTAMASLAVDESLGDAHGVALEKATVAGAGSTNQVAALLSGDLDVAVGGTNTVIDAIAEGAAIQVVGSVAPLLYSIVLNADVAAGLDVTPDASTEERLQALKGLKLAVSPPGSTGNTVLRSMLEGAGLDPDTDVEFVPITDVGAVPAGISRGTYDGSFVAVGAGEVNISDGSGTLWLSIPRGDVEAFADYMGVVSFTTTRFAEENPDTVRAVHDALADAQQLVTDDPERVAEVLKETVFAEMDQAVFDVVWDQVKDAYPAGMDYTEKHWETFVSLFDESSDKDYASISYDDLVAESVRGD